MFSLIRRVSVGFVAVGATYTIYERRNENCNPLSTVWRHVSQYRLKAFAAEQVQDELPVWNDDWDNRKFDNESGDNKRIVRRHLLFIRHGQYNLEGKTDTERVLTALGREQAAYTANRLRELNIKIEQCNSSTMQRAIETATIIADELGVDFSTVQQSDTIREGWPIEPIPGSMRQNRRRSSERPATGCGDSLPNGSAIPNADEKFTSTIRKELRRFERNAESERIERAFRTIFYRPSPNAADSYEIYVCHANVIRYFVCRALQLDAHAWLRFALAHASITHLVILSNGRVVAQAIGEAGHIPAEKRSF